MRERSSDDIVRLYLDDLGTHALLTKADEVRLAQAVLDGRRAVQALSSGVHGDEERRLRRLVALGQQAERRFVESNLRLVVSIARRYQASGLPLLDLIQEGNLGLMHAIEKFDHTKGFKFSTYATWWIRQAITRGIANTSTIVRAPVHAGDKLAAVNRVRTELTQELGRPPTDDEMVEVVGQSAMATSELVRVTRNVSSISEPLSAETGTTFADSVPDDSEPVEEAATRWATVAEVHHRLEALSPEEQQFLAYRYGLDDGGQDRPLKEVAERFGISRETARKLELRCLERMRRATVGAAAH